MTHRPWHGRSIGGRTYFARRTPRQPVAFSLARLGAPPRVILERARMAQRLSHVLLVVRDPYARWCGRDGTVRCPLIPINHQWVGRRPHPPARPTHAQRLLHSPSGPGLRHIAAPPGSLPPACSPSPPRTLCTGSFRGFVNSTTVPMATGWNDSCRAGNSPTERTRLSPRTDGRGLDANNPRIAPRTSV